MSPDPTMTTARRNDRGLVDDALFVVLAYAFFWLCLLLPIAAEHRRMALTLGTFAPTFAALIVAAKQGGGARVVVFLKKLLTFRAPVSSYLLAWYLVPALLFVSFVAFGFRPAKGTMLDVFVGIVVAAPLNYTVAVVFFGTAGPQGEELGWRGYLLTRWRERFGEARAPLFVGIVWALWHLPLFFEPNWGTPELPLAANIGLYVVNAVLFSYVFAAIYWLSRNSIIVVILLHGAVNASNMMLGSYEGTLLGDNVTQTWALLVAGIASAAIAQSIWFVVRRRREHRAA